MTNPLTYSVTYLGAVLTYSLIGWKVALWFGVRRGMPGFGWYVWGWPLAIPLAIVRAFYAGLREGLALYFAPQHIADETENEE